MTFTPTYFNLAEYGFRLFLIIYTFRFLISSVLYAFVTGLSPLIVS